MKWLILAAAVAGLYGLHRLALWAEQKGWIFYIKRKPSPASLGTAFLEIQQLAQPEKRHIAEARANKKAQQEDQGGPDKSGGKRTV